MFDGRCYTRSVVCTYYMIARACTGPVTVPSPGGNPCCMGIAHCDHVSLIHSPIYDCQLVSERVTPHATLQSLPASFQRRWQKRGTNDCWSSERPPVADWPA